MVMLLVVMLRLRRRAFVSCATLRARGRLERARRCRGCCIVAKAGQADWTCLHGLARDAGLLRYHNGRLDNFLWLRIGRRWSL